MGLPGNLGQSSLPAQQNSLSIDCHLELFVAPPFELTMDYYEVETGRVALMIVGQAATNQFGEPNVYLGGELLSKDATLQDQSVRLAVFKRNPGRIRVECKETLVAISTDPNDDALVVTFEFELWLHDPQQLWNRVDPTDLDVNPASGRLRFHERVEQKIKERVESIVRNFQSNLLSDPNPQNPVSRIEEEISTLLQSWGLFSNAEETMALRRDPELFWDTIFELRIAEDTYILCRADFLDRNRLVRDRNDPGIGTGESLFNQACEAPQVLDDTVAWLRNIQLPLAADTLEKLCPGPILGTQAGALSRRVIQAGLRSPSVGVGEWINRTTQVGQSYLDEQSKATSLKP